MALDVNISYSLMNNQKKKDFSWVYSNKKESSTEQQKWQGRTFTGAHWSVAEIEMRMFFACFLDEG